MAYQSFLSNLTKIRVLWIEHELYMKKRLRETKWFICLTQLFVHKGNGVSLFESIIPLPVNKIS